MQLGAHHHPSHSRPRVLAPNHWSAAPALLLAVAATQPQLNATLTRGVASLQQYALNFTEPTTTTVQQQTQDGLCPSGAVLNWAYRAGTRQPGALAPPPRTAAAALCRHLLTPPGPGPFPCCSGLPQHGDVSVCGEHCLCVHRCCGAVCARSGQDLQQQRGVGADCSGGPFCRGGVWQHGAVCRPRDAVCCYEAQGQQVGPSWGALPAAAPRTRSACACLLSCHGPAPWTPSNHPPMPAPATLQVQQQGQRPQGGGRRPQLQQDAVPRRFPARQGRQLALHRLRPRLRRTDRHAGNLHVTNNLSWGHASTGLPCWCGNGGN